MEEIKGTRDLFLETLTKIGCLYELAEEEDDNRIFFPTRSVAKSVPN